MKFRIYEIRSRFFLNNFARKVRIFLSQHYLYLMSEVEIISIFSI